jgi:lipopolysaccharide/colanic/teichoic acid biosynthesis glycosyltransferase
MPTGQPVRRRRERVVDTELVPVPALSKEPGVRTNAARAEVAALIEARIDAEIRAGAEIRLSRRYVVTKRVLDIVVSGALLVAATPLLALIALLIRLESPGPAFFIQDRVGYRGRIFRLVKFRTMVVGSPLMVNGASHKFEYDARITRVGRWLRKTSLDELPQLVNVLRGEMSLVGPRPEIVEIVLDRYEPWQYRRFLVPQGLTGWWQVTGRGLKLLYKHTTDDLYYIEHASMRFDLKILALTIRAVILRHGAF